MIETKCAFSSGSTLHHIRFFSAFGFELLALLAVASKLFAPRENSAQKGRFVGEKKKSKQKFFPKKLEKEVETYYVCSVL